MKETLAVMFSAVPFKVRSVVFNNNELIAGSLFTLKFIQAVVALTLLLVSLAKNWILKKPLPGFSEKLAQLAMVLLVQLWM